MRTTVLKILGFTAFIFLTANSFVFAQTDEVRQAEARVNQITSDSGRFFKQGLLNLKDNRRPQAGEDFNKSVEVFLMSGINLTSKDNAKARDCYNQLVETIYRIEFPADAQLPQVRPLSATCGWNIDNQLADDIAKIVRQPNQPKANVDNSIVASAVNQIPTEEIIGFNDQKFEASPLDELSKLELTPEELAAPNTPEAQQQYYVIQSAIANQSYGFTFQNHEKVQQYLAYYRGRGRQTMEIGLYRSGMFMRMARRIFKEEGVPENVAWLGQVESAWKPSALSWAAASGLWQFIPGTGTRFGLRRTAHVDERNSFDEATRASARYLKFLANRYNGNWELAMGAYNCGEGNVDKAIRRAGVANFWAAYPFLPQETRNYVPNILATMIIANSPQQYGFGHIRPAAPLQYDRVRVPPSTSLNLLAQASDTTIQYLRYLNPHFRTNSTPPEPYIVNIPAGKSNEVVALFRRAPASKINNSNLANSAVGETWQTISNRTGVSATDLMAANPGMKIPRGKVFVPQGNNVANTNYARPTTPINNSARTSNIRVVKAQAGETLETLANRIGVKNVTEIAKFNGLLPNSKLNGGREIRIP